MAKMTISDLQQLAKTYVAAAKQAGAWQSTTNNIFGAVDKIGKMVRLDGGYIDKLPELDGEELPLGKTIEEYFVDLTLPEAYTTASAEGAKDLAPAFPSVEDCSYAYTLGKETIKTTVPYNDLERAALNTADSANMVAKILERLGNSYERFKFAAKKQLIGNAADKAVVAGTAETVQTIAAPTDTNTGEAFLKQVKKDVETASFAHDGGLAGARIGAAPSLTLFIKKGVRPSLEVDTLAGAFHDDRLAIPAKVVVLDDFGSMVDSKVYALLVDPRGIKLHRGYHAIRQSPNGTGDYVSYIDHSEHTGFISKFVYIKAYKGA